MDWKIFLATAGWLLAIAQFVFSHRETRTKNEYELLEKTLGYFERGAQSRAIAISLVEGVWVKRQKNLEIILPVLISQASYLLTDVDNPYVEERNLIRILYLIEKCLPFANDPLTESIEISNALFRGAQTEGGVNLSNQTLKHWFGRFNSGSVEQWEAEIESS